LSSRSWASFNISKKKRKKQISVSGAVQRGGYKYLDVRLEHSHLVNAAEEGECMAREKFAKGSGVREGVAQGGFADFGDLEL
jgi:hypothetical protein